MGDIEGDTRSLGILRGILTRSLDNGSYNGLLEGSGGLSRYAYGRLKGI